MYITLYALVIAPFFLPADKAYLNTFRLLSNNTGLGKTFISMWLNKFSRPVQRLLFAAGFGTFAAVVMLLNPLWFSSWFLEFFLLVSMAAWSVWNGANFYVEVFAGQYKGSKGK